MDDAEHEIGTKKISQLEDDKEKEELETVSDANPGVVVIGERTGQLALTFQSERDDNITDVLITRTGAQLRPDGSYVPPRFHVLVAGVKRKVDSADEPFHIHKTFESSMVAIAYVEESIKDFDLLEVKILNGEDLVFE